MADLKHGVKRLEQYVEQLKIISGMMKENPNKRPIDQNMLIEWSNLAFDLVKNHEMSIEIQKQEESKLDVIKEQLTNALQNVIVNSIDHSLPNSQLILSFEDDSDKYRIIVQDQGTGFSSQALNQATKRYFTTNVNSTNAHYGLGLTIVEEILSSYNGQLKLENVVSEGKVVGAKVTMCLYKTNSFM